MRRYIIEETHKIHGPFSTTIQMSFFLIAENIKVKNSKRLVISLGSFSHHSAKQFSIILKPIFQAFWKFLAVASHTGVTYPQTMFKSHGMKAIPQ